VNADYYAEHGEELLRTGRFADGDASSPALIIREANGQLLGHMYCGLPTGRQEAAPSS